jgi:predicted deacetylase
MARLDRHIRGSKAALLVSIHDVSPLTLENSQRAVAVALEAGVPAQALTVLVIPHHEERIALDEHPATRAWLGGLVERGAQLVMHGYTHRMQGRRYSPAGVFWAYGFARGQGELFNCTAAETETRLRCGREILDRAGMADATKGFVPPAWLLSRQARRVVEAAGFSFYETLGGIVVGSRLLARRLIGWGSLNAVETKVTCAWAAVQRRRVPVDTRLAIHPADMVRAQTRASIRRALDSLVDRTSMLSYRDYLA